MPSPAIAAWRARPRWFTRSRGETGSQRTCDPSANAQRGAWPSGASAMQACAARSCGVREADELRAALGVAAARRGQAEGARRAIDEADAELLLEERDAPGDRLLRHPEGPGGGGEAARRRERRGQAHVVEAHD